MRRAGVLLLTQQTEKGTHILVRSTTLRERLAVRLRSASLDERLAAGADPDSHPLLLLRAQYLLSRRTRLQLAQGLRWLVQSAQRPPSTAPYIGLSRGQISALAPALEELATHLECSTPVDVRGVAVTRFLLCDPMSPLCHPPYAEAAGPALAEALQALTPAVDANDGRSN